MGRSFGACEDLASYVDAVERNIDETLETSRLDQVQIRLLRERSRVTRRSEPIRHQLAPFYFLVRSHDAEIGQDAVRLGAAFMMLHRSLNVIDNIQDDEQSGPFETCSPAVALGCGLSLFYLAIDAFWQLETCWGSGDVRRVVRRECSRLARGQHRDLRGRGSTPTLNGALEVAVEKSATCTLLMKLAGVYTSRAAGPETGGLELYRVIGDAWGQIQQTVNDIVAVFGWGKSDDPRTATIPAAALLEVTPTASCRGAAGPDGREAFQRALFESGALQRVADVTEQARQRLHAALGQLPGHGPYAAMFGVWIDDLVTLFYRPGTSLPYGTENRAEDVVGLAALSPNDRALFTSLCLREGLHHAPSPS